MNHICSNADRAQRVRHALVAYRAYTGDGPCSAAEDLIDLLTDAKHFADLEGLNYVACERIAYDHYHRDLHGENGGGR